MDAKINNMRTMIEGDSDNEGGFTKLPSPMLRRRVLKTTLRPEPDGYNPFAKAKEQDNDKAEPAAKQGKQTGPQKPADPGASLF
jgi:hypothetical protein